MFHIVIDKVAVNESTTLRSNLTGICSEVEDTISAAAPPTAEVWNNSHQNADALDGAGCLLAHSSHSIPSIDENEKHELAAGEILQPFSAGNPHVEVIKGNLHLFRELQEKSKDQSRHHKNLPSLRSHLVAVIALPHLMTTTELCHFVASHRDKITHIRFLRDPKRSRSIVLIELISQEAADDFYLTFNGKRYNLLEKKVCNLVFVAKITVESGLPLPYTSAVDHSLAELPSCPVCLERLDCTVSGMVTTVCNHTFHCDCLSLWEDSSCPVCRYCADPFGTGSKCETCGTTERYAIYYLFMN